MKYLFWILTAVCGLSFVACSETTEESEFAGNWEERNTNYLDSIAKVARANQGTEAGQWVVLKSYKRNADSGLGTVDNQYYAYAKILEVGEGEDSPLFSDSVQVHYRGRLIPTVSYPEGYVFDQNYYGELTETSMQWAPTSNFLCSGLITGWTTLLQKMHRGDRWMMYIPETLGYGTSATDDIPGYSTLIFDVYLKDFGF